MKSQTTPNALTAKHSTSVITPCYNSEKTINFVITSVAQQQLTPRQHIIIDDGSTDSTPEILQELCKKYPHIHYLQQKNQGAGAARNLGIEAANGRYIMFLDSDDQWHPEKISTQVTFMEDSNTIFSYGDYSLLNRTGTLLPPPTNT